MAKQLLPDELWEIVEPLIPKHEVNPKGGNKGVNKGVILLLIDVNTL